MIFKRYIFFIVFSYYLSFAYYDKVVSFLLDDDWVGFLDIVFNFINIEKKYFLAFLIKCLDASLFDYIQKSFYLFITCLTFTLKNKQITQCITQFINHSLNNITLYNLFPIRYLYQFLQFLLPLLLL